ncbi:hypothetical protein B0H15DRAFT_477147 [Mycena belliarum]|uniref:Uncharacterized protein n=1 Tax=Mycena belliarum TaxID=1033014 RepID=A0AAD6TX66_9AGAR|nr:hypothetical protein B0H15DRAFT_477147 [Mycena belliae]
MHLKSKHRVFRSVLTEFRSPGCEIGVAEERAGEPSRGCLAAARSKAKHAIFGMFFLLVFLLCPLKSPAFGGISATSPRQGEPARRPCTGRQQHIGHEQQFKRVARWALSPRGPATSTARRAAPPCTCRTLLLLPASSPTPASVNRARSMSHAQPKRTRRGAPRPRAGDTRSARALSRARICRARIRRPRRRAVRAPERRAVRAPEVRLECRGNERLRLGAVTPGKRIELWECQRTHLLHVHCFQVNDQLPRSPALRAVQHSNGKGRLPSRAICSCCSRATADTHDLHAPCCSAPVLRRPPSSIVSSELGMLAQSLQCHATLPAPSTPHTTRATLVVLQRAATLVPGCAQFASPVP